MAQEIIIPTADQIIGPALDKLYEERPNSFRHANLGTGVYWHPILGYRAQAAKILQRLALLASERRLKTATGQALRDYVASEFDAVPGSKDTRTFAEGHIVLGREDVLDPLPGGPIPKGTRFARVEATTLGVVFAAAEYETIADGYMPVDSIATVTIPIRALRAGAFANAPILTSTLTAQSFPKLFDNLSVHGFEAAGGSDGVDDDFVRLFAKTYALGQYGPTIAASKLGAILGSGVRHFIVYDDFATTSQKILVADASWGSSTRWASAVQQSMYDADVVGFGCKVTTGKVRNVAVSVDAAIILRDPGYLTDTTEIDLAVQKATRSYFDDRSDWNVWNKESLRAAISNAHSKIFRCSDVTLKKAIDSSEISEILTPDYAVEQFHYYVASNGMTLTYAGPS